MRLKYFIDEKGKKVYTLKSNLDNKTTLDAHYKFIKVISASKTTSLDSQPE